MKNPVQGPGQPGRILDGSYQFEKIEAAPTDSPDCPYGWKIHISIANDDFQRAWDAVYPIIIAHGIFRAKVRTPMSELPFQPGKEITIYSFKSPGLDWGRILNEIEAVLIAKQVRPNPVGPFWRVAFQSRTGLFGLGGIKIESIETKIPEPLVQGSHFLYCEDDTPVESTAAAAIERVSRIMHSRDRGFFSNVVIATTVGAAGAGKSVSAATLGASATEIIDDFDPFGLAAAAFRSTAAGDGPAVAKPPSPDLLILSAPSTPAGGGLSIPMRTQQAEAPGSAAKPPSPDLLTLPASSTTMPMRAQHATAAAAGSTTMPPSSGAKDWWDIDG
jgi:hypothetical protein